jgi:ankyrin repeat protein
MSTASPKRKRAELVDVICCGNVERVRLLLATGVETNFDVSRSLQPMASGRSLLHMIIYLRQMAGSESGATHLRIMQLLINEGGTDPNRVSPIGPFGNATGLYQFGNTPLNHAAGIEDVEAVDLLLKCNADPAGISVVAESETAPVSIYYTALHCAADNDNDTVARLLINAGADINASGIGGITPLQIAQGRKHERVLAVLREAGANNSS